MMEDDDESLEAELAALTAGNDTGYKSRRSAARKTATDENLDAMISDCMKDTNSDDEPSEGDDDPALLKELQMLTGNETEEKTETPELMEEEQAEHESTETKEENNSVQELIKLLQERLKIYEIAEEKAKRNNETGRARRYNRGVKTLKEMLVYIQSGKSVNEADIPPALPSSATAESTVENIEEKTPLPVETVSETVATSNVSNDDNSPEPVAVTVDQEALDKLKNQQQKYKTAAIAWKRAGNKEQALEYVKTIKQFDIVIAAVAAGEKLDLSDMPPTPILPSPTNPAASATKEESEVQQQASTDGPAKCGPENIEGALKERLEVYRRTKVTAENEGNTSKARRYGRICKQFEDAIKLYTHGKVVLLDELPVPPGFPPLSLNPQNNDTVVQPTSEPESSENNTVKKPAEPKPPIPPPRTGKKNVVCRCSLNPILCCTHPRGFFRSDSLLGTVMVKLQPLESQCTLHDSFPLMDGRKATGGKLELKVRLRNPILFKQIENITDKWLTIDQ
ncbi:PREDICTED: coiled-coil and C2 domain-containing protein 1-like [Wasmannia auropunctata]|uniref:coiled-coil and C2 domain-containing protein 1-like n=1 Tax=Wasmannia auropunctata TaxID=64793 RepID=UPI0005EE381B|nr:PREDICTED: coiled-coil and C2 domain-containing protein 1-like [Wasmannia auropunctata]